MLLFIKKSKMNVLGFNVTLRAIASLLIFLIIIKFGYPKMMEEFIPGFLTIWSMKDNPSFFQNITLIRIPILGFWILVIGILSFLNIWNTLEINKDSLFIALVAGFMKSCILSVIIGFAYFLASNAFIYGLVCGMTGCLIYYFITSFVSAIRREYFT